MGLSPDLSLIRAQDIPVIRQGQRLGKLARRNDPKSRRPPRQVQYVSHDIKCQTQNACIITQTSVTKR